MSILFLFVDAQEQLLIFRFPDLYGFVAAGGRKQFSIRRERNAVDGVIVRGNILEELEIIFCVLG